MLEGVRVGVIGTGWWAETIYLPSIESHPFARITAICGGKAERSAELSRRAGGARIFDDYRALVTSGEVDAVVVATPDDLRYSVTMASTRRWAARALREAHRQQPSGSASDAGQGRNRGRQAHDDVLDALATAIGST